MAATEAAGDRARFRLADQPIAIVGLSGIFPEAPDLARFWTNILAAADCTSEVPANRWRIADYYDPDPAAEDKTYCRRGGFIPDVDFDPLEFGLPPNSLEVTDVVQLLSLIVAKEALRDAGYAEADAALRERTAVVLGVGGGQKLLTPLTARLQYPVWNRVLRSAGLSEREATTLVEKIKLAYVPWVEASFPGMLGNVIAGRVANRLDLGGMNCVVDAACASSFAALKASISELVEHRADLVISGGVDTDNTILMYMCFSKTPAFSRAERIRPFDSDAAGTMLGEGLGMYVLKRLSDAERDGDRIYAVIRGIGSSSDGRSKSIYAPLSSGQAVALRRAYDDAACNPDSVGLVEAHGTGTAAGDACELTTLHDVFASAAPRSIGLGSVKSQIGHTKSAAGAAGLIKVALALHHKVLPPTINVETPAEGLRRPDSPFYVSARARPWLSAGTPRRGAVSSFGFGGTNYHVVLEEHGGEQTGPYRLQRLPEAVVVGADTPADLAARCAELAARLDAADGAAVLAELVALPPPPRAAARVGAVDTDAADASTLLARAAELIGADPDADQWHREDLGLTYRRVGLDLSGEQRRHPPGQGSQYVGMLGAVAAAFPELRSALDLADRVARDGGGTPISNIVYPPPVPGADPRAGADRLRETRHAQPAIGAVSRGLWTLLTRAGFAADLLAGHSFGELTALWAAGAVDEHAVAVLADARGRVATRRRRRRHARRACRRGRGPAGPRRDGGGGPGRQRQRAAPGRGRRSPAGAGAGAGGPGRGGYRRHGTARRRRVPHAAGGARPGAVRRRGSGRGLPPARRGGLRERDGHAVPGGRRRRARPARRPDPATGAVPADGGEPLRGRGAVLRRDRSRRHARWARPPDAGRPPRPRGVARSRPAVLPDPPAPGRSRPASCRRDGPATAGPLRGPHAPARRNPQPRHGPAQRRQLRQRADRVAVRVGPRRRLHRRTARDGHRRERGHDPPLRHADHPRRAAFPCRPRAGRFAGAPGLSLIHI